MEHSGVVSPKHGGAHPPLREVDSQARPLSEGLYLIQPLLDLRQRSTQVLQHYEEYDAVTKNLQDMHVEMVQNCRLLSEKALDVYQKIGVNFADVIVLPVAQEVLKANTALHAANEILRQRSLIKADVQDTLAAWPCSQRVRRHTSKGKEPSKMRDRHDALQHWNGWPPAWRPQPGEILAGVIDRYAIGHTLHGPVRTVIVSEEPTGERVSLWLSSTSLLSLFAQHQPRPGDRIGVRYRWRDPHHSYSRWRLIVDRREPLDFSALGGEASDEAPWHREKGVAREPGELAEIMVLEEWPHRAVYRWPENTLHLQVIEGFCRIWHRWAPHTRLLTAMAPLRRALRVLPML